MKDNTVYKRAADDTGANIVKLKADNTIEEIVIKYGNHLPKYIENESFYNSMKAMSVPNVPHVVAYNNEYVFGVYQQPHSLIIFGPVKMEIPFRLRFRAQGEKLVNIKKVSSIKLSKFALNLQMLFELTTDTTLDIVNYYSENTLEDSLVSFVEREAINSNLENIEINEAHHSMAPIRQLEMCVRTGDMVMIVDAVTEMINAPSGRTAKDELRNAKNLSIAGITNVTRSAIEGGVPYTIAYAMSDSYISLIEQAANSVELGSIFTQACLHFTKQVAEQARVEKSSSQVNFYIERTKRYILEHLSETIEVKNIADELNISSNYLSSLFKKSENITISQYVANEKIAHAKRMLIFSDDSFSDIAFRLGFSTQSHFGSTFKKITGMTPFQYQMKHKKVK
ncbi:MAG: helix-turn-helix domain-containing protein [Clostridia bacterium]|nr:helix-turn-helix domain-containing protein [Clostridia bacterium]